LRIGEPTYFAGAFVGSIVAPAAGAAFFLVVVFFFRVVDFFLVVVPFAVVLESIELEEDIDEEVEEPAAGATAVGFGAAADWARRPVGSATATPIARIRARDLFIFSLSFRRGAKRTAR
jgi:hypothetical protein